jgi:RNA polymerase sigma factor (sigma-70 family)
MPAEASDNSPQLTARGDEAHMFATYAPRLRAQVRRIVGTSPENVDDACSFAFLQLLRYQPDRDSAYPWLVKVAVREAVKLDRRSRRTLSLGDRDGDHDASSEAADRTDTLALRLEVISAREAIAAAQLSNRQARIVALQAGGLDYEQIAAREDITLRTVERQMLRARRKLREARRSTGG